MCSQIYKMRTSFKRICHKFFKPNLTTYIFNFELKLLMAIDVFFENTRNFLTCAVLFVENFTYSTFQQPWFSGTHVCLERRSIGLEAALVSKEKTDIRRMITTIQSGIRAYKHICIAESTVQGLHGPPLTGRSLFTCRVAGDQIELN
jgi:hypothetical protein